VKPGVPVGKAKIVVERKPGVVEKAPKSSAAAAPAAGAGGGTSAGAKKAASVPFVYNNIVVDKNIFSPINVQAPDADIKNGQIEGGSFSIQSRQFSQLEMSPVRALQVLGQGGNTVSELFEPQGQKIVQVVGTPPPEGGNAWGWATLRDWTVADAAGKSYPAVGALAKVKQGNADRMAASFNIAGNPKDITAEEGVPTDVWLVFSVPSGTHLKQLKHKGSVAQDVDLAVP
jgi:hypothetical protein